MNKLYNTKVKANPKAIASQTRGSLYIFREDQATICPNIVELNGSFVRADLLSRWSELKSPLGYVDKSQVTTGRSGACMKNAAKC